ncbi:MAG: FG-GAP-like repeat-containing protein [Oscillospiraceae bacterium]|nr:FG-GAP-like repeat-containing protein [Oscillospiraceae bacterium]
MSYYIANEKVDLKYYPNYSFEVGDVDGDGKMEFISLNQSGTLLKTFNLESELLFEKNLDNTGNWGTAIICAADIDGDGRDEIIVPAGKSIAAFDGKGNKIREYKLESGKKESYGLNVPLIGVAKISAFEEISIVAYIAGGEIVALDTDFKEIWKTGGFRNDCGHEIHFADIDGDGFDEIAFCTVDCHIDWSGKRTEPNAGDLVLLDHDGTVMLRKRVDGYIDDSHFDDIAMGNFLGEGNFQILVEKGILLDFKGDVIWNISEKFEHGQWIAHTSAPNHNKGRIVFISELWGSNKRGLLFSGNGKNIKDITNILPWTAFDSEEHKKLNLKLLPSRCHIIQWAPESEPEIFLSQQAHMPFVSGPISEYHRCYQTVRFQLKAMFMDLQGNLLGEAPFGDSQIKDYFYNGEVHSRIADVDGDGRQEIIFPKQDGRVMIVKKHI